MTRSQTATAMLGVLVLLGTVGCDSSKEMQIGELQRQLDGLEKTNADLESQLSTATRDADDARRRALQLQQMLDQCRADLQAARNRPTEPAAVQPQLPAGWVGNEKVAMTEVGTDILFDSGRATLRKEGQAALDEIASVIQTKFPDRQIWVIGHTDSDPIKRTKNLWEDNLDLSLNRAAAVARSLFSLGVDAKRTVVAGQGEANPKVPNTSKENKRLNRRVEIFAVDASILPS